MDQKIIVKVVKIITYLRDYEDEQSVKFRRFFEALLESDDRNLDVPDLSSYSEKEKLVTIRACYDSLQRYMILNHKWNQIMVKEGL